MSTYVWVAVAVVALVFTLTLRLAVRFLARGADNGWDNAVGYFFTTVCLAIPLRWMIDTHSIILIALSPALFWAAQTVALKVIYQLKGGRAWLLGLVHTLFASVILGGMTLTAGFVAAYILYGRIISDPIYLVRLILRLLGIEL